MRTKLICIAAFFLFCLPSTGCKVADQYVAADMATFEAIGPEYKTYVEADPSLDADQKSRRLRTLETWKLRLQGGIPK